MGTQVVEHNNLTLAEGRSQDLLHIGEEGQGISSTRQHQGWPHPLEAQGGDQGRVGGFVARDAAKGALLARSPSIARREVEVAAALIDNDKILGRASQEQVTEGGSGLLVSLAGTNSLFLRDQPRREKARSMVARATGCSGCC